MAKILLIDDEVAVLHSMSVVMHSDRHEIVTISDSAKALDIVKAGDYDLIVTDIRMSPVDGMQILKLAHDTHPSKPVIVVSAYGSDATVQQCLALGCKAYIRKPFKVQTVQDAVEKALAGK